MPAIDYTTHIKVDMLKEEEKESLHAVQASSCGNLFHQSCNHMKMLKKCGTFSQITVYFSAEI
jgi:hypothetical protein